MTKLLFDWINPLDGVWGRLVHGPMHRFTFHAPGDFSGSEVEMLMRQYGIRIWGREMDDDEERAFLVKRSQAIWAEYLLCRVGVPLTSPLLDPRNAQYAVQHDDMPDPWQERGIGPNSLVDHAVSWIDRLVG